MLIAVGENLRFECKNESNPDGVEAKFGQNLFNPILGKYKKTIKNSNI